MLTLEYQQKDLLERACSAIDNGEAFAIVVYRQNASIVKASLRAYQEFSKGKITGKMKFLNRLKFWYHGMRSPTLWGVLIYAESWDIETTFENTTDRLTILFRKKDGVRGSTEL